MSIESEGHAAFDSQVAALDALEPRSNPWARDAVGSVLAVLAGCAFGALVGVLLISVVHL